MFAWQALWLERHSARSRSLDMGLAELGPRFLTGFCNGQRPRLADGGAEGESYSEWFRCMSSPGTYAAPSTGPIPT